MRSLQPPDILWIHWRVYNSIANTKLAGTLSAPFCCLCQELSLSSLYFNKTLLHKSSERSSLISGPRLNSPPEAKNPSIFAWFSNNLSTIHSDFGAQENKVCHFCLSSHLFCILAILHCRKWRKTKEPLDEGERREWKNWLRIQHSKNENHGIWSHHFMAKRWRKWKQW